LFLAAAIAAFVYWAGYRVLPQLDGDIAASGLKQAGSIQRDERGIPTILASNLDDALFLQGYATAQDRLFQMDAIRRKAAGTLSQVVGPAAIELDMDSRKLRLGRIAAAHARTMSEADRAMLAAYARGVNEYIRAHRDRLPMEFTLLGYDPAPWTVSDSILAGLEMYRSLTTTWKHEIQKSTLLAGAPHREMVELLYPPRTGGEIAPGSNAWAVSGKHTATGLPLLSNDPHLMWTLPSTWHAVRIQSPDLHVAGVALPGVPGVVVGHNEQIAWGVTNLGFDVQDLYDERADLNKLSYEYQGRQYPIQVEREGVMVKGQRVYALDVLVTRHGPVVLQAGQILALRWTAAEPGVFQFPFIELNRAQNWEQFRAALKRFSGPGQNFVYADKAGNIGYQATGMLPVRKTYGGDVPAQGWSGEQEWEGFIPFDDLPSSFNPADGYVVTANQNPFPANYKYPVHGDFSPPYRANQIRRLLGAGDGLKAAGMTAIQKDVYSAFSHFLARHVVEAFDKRKPTNPSLPPAIASLRGWDGQMERDRAAPLIATFVYQRLKRKVVDRVSFGRGEAYQDQMSQAVLQRLLTERPGGWFEDWDKTLIACLDEAVEDIRKQQGSEIGAWRYGAYNEVTIPHPILGRIPYVGEWLTLANVGPAEMSGSATTVKQTGRNIGPSMRFTSDLGDLNESRLDLTIGESGNLLSPNYKDQWETYWSGGSTPFAFDKADVRHTLKLRPPQ
jgi:penicillin amidase